MMTYNFEKQHSTSLKILYTVLIVLVAALACGATGSQKKVNKNSARTSQNGSASPMKPLTYDPRVSLSPLVERTAPAVVNIKTSKTIRMQRQFGSMFDFFFGAPQGMGRRHQNQLPDNVQKSMGSGFIIDQQGYVVTNHHVVDGADKIEVQLADERTFEAKVVGSDERTDVALLKISNAKGLPTVKLGNSSKLKVGDHVVAIGNPFGLSHTVTSGIVSAKERVIGAGPYDDFIQTDASINPGNSGGPLFNLAGEVIGINTAITRTGQGIGFAIPSDMARSIIESIRNNGKVVRGWLGIAFQPLDEALATALGLKNANGALVASVNPGSPAESSGLEERDVIVAVNGDALDNAQELPGKVARLIPGKQYPFEIIHNGQKKTIHIKVGAMDGESTTPIAAGNTDSAGISVTSLNDQLRSQLQAADVKQGVVVESVAASSPASHVLQRGDIVTEVNAKPITSTADFKSALADATQKRAVAFRIYRRGQWTYVAVRF